MTKPEIHFYSQHPSFLIKNKNVLKKWVKDTIISENKTPGQISIIFCSDDDLLDLNKQYLNHDTLTDIITFDYSEKDILNGDVFISIDRVNENAISFDVKFQNELNRVIIHGVLHLCGYKDKTKSDKMNMRSKEDFYLELNPQQKN
ncbi:MAG: rRNA maturation RNase YbeY [Bacteroidota bacterium]|nr:rRNA maturation RNase YbeY [Bacteroidota bacterium]